MGFQYDPIGRPKSVPVSSTLTMAWRGDGLRGWKQNGSSPKVYYLYDGDLPICELDSSGLQRSGPDGIRRSVTRNRPKVEF